MAGEPLPIPTACLAEAVVAGCAAATARGARLAGERLRPADFYEPATRRVFVSATDAGVAGAFAAAEHRAAPGDRQDARLDVLAKLAGVERAWLGRLVAERAVMWDETGSYAHRVADAGHRRRVMALAADLHAAAATGGDLAPVLAEMRRGA
jgi:replicative DNA helicase